MENRLRLQPVGVRIARQIIIACVFICVLALAACGGRKQPSVVSLQSSDRSGCQPQHQVTPPAVNQGQSAEIAEILAAPVPDGVDPKLWETLTGELATQLNTRCVAKYRVEYVWGILEIWSAKHDDQWFVEWDNTFFHWDGSGNGVVDIADLTPLAVHFGQDGEAEPGAGVADYNWDGNVGIEDLTPLAVHYGEQCVGFRVERSTTARGAGYVELGTVDYTDVASTDDHGYNVYRFPITSSDEEYEWHRVVALDELGNVIAMDPMGGWCGEGAGGGSDPSFPVQDLEVVRESPPVITWCSSFFVGDGNQDGDVGISDVGPIAFYFGYSVDETPLATVADYDGSGIVDLMDWECLACHFGENCAGFAVEISVVSPDEGFTEDGYVSYSDCSELSNEYGFRVWEYEIASAPESGTYWMRVTTYDDEYNLGVPSEAIEMGGE